MAELKQVTMDTTFGEIFDNEYACSALKNLRVLGGSGEKEEEDSREKLEAMRAVPLRALLSQGLNEGNLKALIGQLNGAIKSKKLASENEIRDPSHVLKLMYEIMDESNREKLASPILHEGLVREKDISYKNDQSKWHRLDIWYPEKTIEKLPVIINIHGGALIYGTKELNADFCMELARQGFAVVSISYRLIPEVTFLEQIRDVAAAFQYLADHIPEYPADPEQVFLVGDSAGGLLAFMGAALQQSAGLAECFGVERGKLYIKAVGLISSMLDTIRSDGLSMINDFIGTEEEKQNPSGKYLFDPVRVLEEVKLPPVYLVTSEEDMLLEDTLRIRQALDKAGTPNRLIRWGKGGEHELEHVFCVLHPQWEESRKTIEGLCGFLKEGNTKVMKHFLLGASTAAHQVEGNNIYSDCWALEQMEESDFKEPSMDAADHYNRYEEDIRLLAEAGLNAYRFSIEWARIEPEKGCYNEQEILHYEQVLKCCEKYGVTPVVTMHHFSSPKWLISEGGWENNATVGYFADYCRYVVKKLGKYMEYVCTINEANMGIQIAAVIREFMRKMGVAPQIGLNFSSERMQRKKAKTAAIFGLQPDQTANIFLTMRSEQGDILIMKAHEAARNAMKEECPHLKVGLTLSLFDVQARPGGEENAKKEWEADFTHYLPYLQEDDFIGVQNYTRKIFDKSGSVPASDETEVTQMGYEFYPDGIGHVIRKVAKELPLPILVTENGVGTGDDKKRVEYIEKAIAGVRKCIEEGIPVIGYLHWSLLDNFEWQEGYEKTFGLIAVDRSTQKRIPKPSLAFLGSLKKEFV
ncbi:family 1 glycosylhydrolase [Agathobacter sp.]|uniref:family 1 glycosylhydrolase n=1 Tax=Agathobacter sp. TaxID=2021311 RepID=UPI003FD7843E